MSVSSLIREFHVAQKTLAKLLGMPYVLFQVNVPIFLPSSGSIGNNGALTLTTALDAIYPNAYMYFPVNAISAGSSAGLYFVQMSSTTLGTIFNDTYTSGKPAVPAIPTAFVTTGPGAYTQTTATDIVLLSFPLPGTALGANGSLFGFNQGAFNSSASAKTLKMKLGGSATHAIAPTSSGQTSFPFTFRNNGSQNVNTSNSGTGFSTAATSPTHTSIDTASDQTVTLTASLAVATDYAGFVGVLFQINPSN